MADIPFTVIVVLFASLVDCFLILPIHMSHALKYINEKNGMMFQVIFLI